MRAPVIAAPAEDAITPPVVHQEGPVGHWPTPAPLPEQTGLHAIPVAARAAVVPGAEKLDEAAMRLGLEAVELRRRKDQLEQLLLTESDGKIQTQAPASVSIAFAIAVFEAGYDRAKMTALARYVRAGELSKLFKGQRSFDLGFFLRGKEAGAHLAEFTTKATDWADRQAQLERGEATSERHVFRAPPASEQPPPQPPPPELGNYLRAQAAERAKQPEVRLLRLKRLTPEEEAGCAAELEAGRRIREEKRAERQKAAGE